MAWACAFNRTVLGPVLLSTRWSAFSPTSDQRRHTISPLLQPVRSNSRRISACCCPDPRPWCESRTVWRRSISSRLRNRVSCGLGFRVTPDVGFSAMCPHSIAWFMIWRNTSSVRFAPPGAVWLYPSNQRCTSARPIESSDRRPNRGSSCVCSALSTRRRVDSLQRR